MKLSDSARLYLQQSQRPWTPPNREAIRRALSARGVPIFEPVVETFYRFSGYLLPLRGNRSFRILPPSEAILELEECGTISEQPDQFRVLFAEHPTAPVEFFMDGSGRLFADETLIADSLPQWIEGAAIQATVDRWKQSTRVTFPDHEASSLETWFDGEFQRFAPASSSSSIWWASPQLAINIFKPWSGVPRIGRWTWCFASTRDEAEELIYRVQLSTGVEPEDICSWPP